MEISRARYTAAHGPAVEQHLEDKDTGSEVSNETESATLDKRYTTEEVKLPKTLRLHQSDTTGIAHKADDRSLKRQQRSQMHPFFKYLHEARLKDMKNIEDKNEDKTSESGKLEIIRPQIVIEGSERNLFKYNALHSQGDIRLIVLKPSEDPAAPIKCHIFHESLARGHPPRYEALSYVWGDIRDTKPISIDGANHWITDNLWIALSRLRREQEDRVLWVDALCINQGNVSEKNRQVRLMPVIYENAQRVVTWVGEEADDSHLVFQHINGWMAYCDDHRSGRTSWNEGHGGAHLNMPGFPARARKAFDKLCHRPWFFRTWVIQELARGKQAIIKCGADEVNWSALPWRGALLDEGHNPLEEAKGDAYRMGKLIDLRKHGNTTSLERLLEEHRFCGAADPRDKVYALLGVLDKEVMPIDYDLGVEDVFQAATAHIICEAETLQFFHKFQPLRGSDGHASWVLNFDGSRQSGLLSLRIRTSFRHPMSYENEIIPTSRISGDTMCIKGKYVESVYMASEPLNVNPLYRPGSEEFTRVINHWELVASQMINKRFQRPISEAFSDTLICSSDPSSFHYDTEEEFPTASPEFADWYAEYGTNVLRNSEPTFFRRRGKEENSDDIDRNYYMDSIATRCYERQFFTTDQGSLGLGRPEVQAGDQIVFFPGSLYPFILRPRADGTFYFCGDCYLYGFNYLEFGRTVEGNAVEFKIR